MQWLRELIITTMQEWNVPGLAITIIKDNQIVCCEGFGLRDVKKRLPVTSKSLFPIGSCTKAFTTMAMGILVDRGQLDWDTPVRNYLPNFKLYDVYATNHLTLRDLVTHRSGLPSHDAMWYGTSFNRQEIFERLQYLESTHELRAAFQYQSLMYMTAGYLVGQITGGSWEEFVQQEIFEPLEMGNSNFSVSQLHRNEDYALPYQYRGEQVEEIPFRNVDAVGPAGSINSNITDITKWLLLHLNQGKYYDKQLISSLNLLQLHTPQILMPYSESPYFLECEEILHPAYSLGWEVAVYRGHKFIQHSGAIDGFSALTTLVPQNHLGIAILTNLGFTLLPGVLAYQICDHFLRLDEVPWNQRLKKNINEAKDAIDKAKEKIRRERKTGTLPSHPLTDYVGEFENPAYGILLVDTSDGHLIAIFNSVTYKLQHYHYDIFETLSEIHEWSNLLSFFTDKKGNITTVSFSLEPALKESVFIRRPERV